MTVSGKSPAIAQAFGILKTLSADEEARLLAESREKGRRDFMDRMDGAFQEGEQKGKLEVARNALCEGLSADTIARFTGLSVSVIEQLANN